MKQDKAEWVVGLDEDHFNCDDAFLVEDVEQVKA